MSEHKDKTVTIIDNGSCIELARLLIPYFKEVIYYTEWKMGGFPPLNYYFIGRNIPGITKVDNYKSVIDKTNLFIFMDVYSAEDQEDLVKRGKRVYGARYGENLEIYRDKLMVVLKEVGLPVVSFEKVTGFKALREYLKEHKKIWVKINKLRGFTESFFSPDYDLIETYLDELEHKAGAMKELIVFLCFEQLPDMPEIGIDTIYSNGYPTITMAGIESKDAGYLYVMKSMNELPDCLTIVNKKLEPILQELNYRGNISTEVRITKELKPYFIDSTNRQGMPPSFSQWYNYKNLADIYWDGADGIATDPDYKKPYGVEVIIHSEWAEKEMLPIRIPKEIRDNVFLKNYTIREDKPDLVYIIPTTIELQEIGSVCANGDTLEDAIKEVKKICEQIEGIKIDFPLEALEKAQDTIKDLEILGINFFTSTPTEHAKTLGDEEKKEDVKEIKKEVKKKDYTKLAESVMKVIA
jgi:hypothetical protein